jgi:spermidine/putrescine transport system substrate-binding protein
VPYAWGTTGICYRSDLIDEPTSWNDILKPSAQNKGKVTQMTTERWLALPALKSLGYSINTTDDAEIAKAKDLLIASKPDLLAYDDTTFYSRLVSGEANAVVAWDGWCNSRHRGEPGHRVHDPEGGLGPVGRHHGDPEHLAECRCRPRVHQLHP